MTAMTDVAEADWLDLFLTNIDWPLIGDATGLRGSTTAGVFGIGLYTASPGETATSQLTNETTYTGYVRKTEVRSTAGWTVAGTAPTVGDNDNAITYGECTVGTPTISHTSLGTAASGAGSTLLQAAVTASLAVSPGVTPEYAAGAFDVQAA